MNTCFLLSVANSRSSPSLYGEAGGLWHLWVQPHWARDRKAVSQWDRIWKEFLVLLAASRASHLRCQTAFRQGQMTCWEPGQGRLGFTSQWWSPEKCIALPVAPLISEAKRVRNDDTGAQMHEWPVYKLIVEAPCVEADGDLTCSGSERLGTLVCPWLSQEKVGVQKGKQGVRGHENGDVLRNTYLYVCLQLLKKLLLLLA